MRIMGMAEGSIMAIIMAVHMEMIIAAAAKVDWPGMGIHIMDMIHPPGIFIPPDIWRQE